MVDAPESQRDARLRTLMDRLSALESEIAAVRPSRKRVARDVSLLVLVAVLPTLAGAHDLAVAAFLALGVALALVAYVPQVRALRALRRQRDELLGTLGPMYPHGGGPTGWD